MNKRVDYITKNLNTLLAMYEDYATKKSNYKLGVLLASDKIRVVLFEDNEIANYFTISFFEKEEKLREYMSISTFVMLLGNVLIHKKDNVFFNERHKPYLRVMVTDKKLLEIFETICEKQMDMFVNMDMDLVQRSYEEIPRLLRLNNFSYELEALVNRTGTILKRSIR